MRVVLTAGYLAPSKIMWPLTRELNKHGHQTSIFSYTSHKGDFTAHAQALAKHVIQFVGESPFALIGHSLGGLLTHAAVPLLPRVPARLIFIATPHHGCELAQKARKALYAPLFTGPARHTAHGVSLGCQGISTGTIFGQKDKIVTPDEAILPDVPALGVPYGHSELLLRKHTARAVARFVETGSFEESISPGEILSEL